jgi:ABC-2 type transport system ATP-binding protein
MTDAPAPTPAISVRDLVVQYGERHALDGVSLDVAPGAVAGLLGPNGSGKSTLVSVVAGLRRPQSGEARIGGRPLSPEVRRNVGVVFQQSCLDPLMTLHETLTLHGRLFGLGGATLRQRIEMLLARFDLPARTHDTVATLSGGLRRRLELARALLTEPTVLLLDEPTTGLDPDSRRGFWELLRSIAEQPPAEGGGMTADKESRGLPVRGRGITILFATNDVLEAERECDTAAFLHRGRLVTQGSPAELKAGLKHDSVRVECSDGWAGKLAEAVVDWPGVGRVTRADTVLHVTVDDVSSFVPRLFQTKPEGIHTIRIEASTLEDAYFALTGASVSKEEAT